MRGLPRCLGASKRVKKGGFARRGDGSVLAYMTKPQQAKRLYLPIFTRPKEALGNPLILSYNFQMSSAYSRIVRSEENLPIRAVFIIAIFAQRRLSMNASPTRCCASQYA